MNTLGNLLAKLAAPIARPLPPANHDCCRCSKLRDTILRTVPTWQIPQAEAHLGPTGARVWSGLCASCAALEREERVQRFVANGGVRDLAEKRFGINYDVVKQRAAERAQLSSPQRDSREPDDESFGDWVAAEAQRSAKIEERRQEQLRAAAQLEGV